MWQIRNPIKDLLAAKPRDIARGIGVVLLRVVLATVVVSTFFVLTQDFQVFPGALNSLFSHLFGRTYDMPSYVTPSTVTTSDGEVLPIWRVAGKEPVRKEVALIFHGNAETVANTVGIQRWLSSIGITSYAIEFRGYGESTGFPSEKGLQRDGEAAIDFLQKNEQISPEKVIVFGNSIGTGPASYIAAKFQVGTLVLIAPFTSVPDIARSLPLLGFLAPFVWTDFPNREYVGNLTNTCVVAAHGKRDHVIPYTHSEELKAAYKGSRTYTLLTSDDADHNNIFGKTYQDVARELLACVVVFSG